MAIKGVVFDNQAVIAKDHGALFAGMVTDGILRGCAITHTGADLKIGSGHLIAKGRLMKLAAVETVTMTQTSGYARVAVKVDLSGTATETTFAQASFDVKYAASASGFPALTKQDVNSTGSVYEMELCIVQLGAGGISSIVSQCGAARPLGLDGVLTADGILKVGAVNYGNSLPAAGQPGRVFFKKVT